jgi:hypothetical protein
VGDELDDLGGNGNDLSLGLGPQDGDTGFQVRWLDVSDQPAFKPGAQAFLQGDDGPGRPVAGEHDLVASRVQGVERVEELFLGALLAGNKLDVIHQENVVTAVSVAEVLRCLVADGVDEVVGELLRGDVEHPLISL